MIGLQNRFLDTFLRISTVMLLLCSTALPAQVRLAPPQAMFKESVTLKQFVRGTLRFVLLHELGHGFVDLYKIPVLGREEDAADRFATWWLSPDGNEDGTDAIAAIEWWMASGKFDGATREQLAWWGEHSIDEQRGYQIACLLYGSDPEIMEPLAGRLGVPPERRESCIPEAQQNAASWSAYLSGQSTQLIHQLDGFLVPIKYEEPGNADNKIAAQLIRDMQLLDELQSLLGQFKFPDGAVMVRLIAQDCGEPNAYWYGAERSIILCHELVNHVANLGHAAGFR